MRDGQPRSFYVCYLAICWAWNEGKTILTVCKRYTPTLPPHSLAESLVVS
jgi:hypothetical protein